MRLNALVTHEPPWYVARCLEVDAAAQGATAEEATTNYARRWPRRTPSWPSDRSSPS